MNARCMSSARSLSTVVVMVTFFLPPSALVTCRFAGAVVSTVTWRAGDGAECPLFLSFCVAVKDQTPSVRPSLLWIRIVVEEFSFAPVSLVMGDAPCFVPVRVTDAPGVIPVTVMVGVVVFMMLLSVVGVFGAFGVGSVPVSRVS